MSSILGSVILNNLISGTGLLFRKPVVVATTTNATLATEYADGKTVDGSVLSTGDRILLKDQSTASENGIWIVTADAPTRADDMETNSTISGVIIPIAKGTVNAHGYFICTSAPGSDIVGTSNLTFGTFRFPNSITPVTTVAAQTLTNKTIDSDNNTISNIVDADIKAAAAIDCTKIGSGNVSNSELDYLNGITAALVTISATQSLTNKTVIADNFAVEDETSGYQLSFDASALTTNKVLTAADEAGTIATRAYVDTITQGLSAKTSVRVATTVNGTMASSFANGQTVDGVVLATGDRILIKDQTSGEGNGPYIVQASGAPVRAADMDEDAEAEAGAYFFVQEGTTNADSGWVLLTNAPIMLDTTVLEFAQFSGAGQITAGTGLSKSGNTINFNIQANGGLAYNGDNVEVNLAASSITGTLVVASGGTGAVTHGSGNVLVGAGTSAVTSTKAAPSGDFVGTNDVQTLTSKVISSASNTLTIDADVATVSNIKNADIKAAAAINCTKIDSSNITNTELDYLNKITSGVISLNNTQTLTNKIISSASNTLTIDADVATLSNIKNADIKAAAAIDCTKIGSGNITNTELDYLNGITSGVVSLNNTQTLTNKTLTNPLINLINDTNGNESISITATASAVNYFDIRNSVTTAALAIYAAGTDTNIDINIVPKGTALVSISGTLYANALRVQSNTVRIGYDAGLTNQGTGATAVGNLAGRINQGNTCTAVGQNAGYNGQVAGAVAVGNGAGYTGQGENSVAIGNAAGATTQGANSVAVGVNAGNGSQGAASVAMGINAAAVSQGANCVAVGNASAYNTQGAGSVAVGNGAGFTTQGAGSVAVGAAAGYTNQGINSVAVGQNAGYTSQAANCVAIGNAAGQTQGQYSVAVGNVAGQTTQGTYCIAIGHNAGNSLQSNYCVAVGQASGQLTQGLGSTAVGSAAGYNTQGAGSCAFGQNAGNHLQGAGSCAFGNASGQISQGGNSSAYGNGSGYTGQGVYSCAYGEQSASTTQGNNSCAYGAYSGSTTQGTLSCAFGYYAGNNDQGANSCAFGNEAGKTTQSTECAAFGQYAGRITQGQRGTALGCSAGASNQGIAAVAVGYRAGETNQAAGSICINATNGALENTIANSLVIKPIRSVTPTTSSLPLSYVASTGEIQQNANLYCSNLGIGIAPSSLSITMGDSDTGFDWLSDGVLDTWNNNIITHRSQTSDHRFFSNVANAEPSILIKKSASSNPNVFITFFSNETNITTATVNEGDIRTDAGGALYLYNASDARLKENITTYTGSYEKIKKLRVVEFNWKEETRKKNCGTIVGVIAQEVEQVLPKCVGDHKGADGVLYKGITISNFIPFLWGGLKTTIEKVEAQVIEITTLKNTVETQATEITTLKSQMSSILERLTSLEAK